MIDWEDIARRHGPLVWKTVYRLLGGGGPDASDCFQETFLAALDYAKRQEVRNWPGLLQRIATTRALDLINRRRTERRRFGDDGASALGHVPSGRAGPHAAMEDSETMVRFREVLAELSQPQREVFCLRHFSEMSYEEIATVTGLNADTVGVTLHRARAWLRELLAPADVAVAERRS